MDNPSGGLIELQTRFLYPFFFERQKVREACQALDGVTVTDRNGHPQKVWENATPHEFYKEELLKNVVGFLFEDREESGCGYLRLSGLVANRWFHNVEVELSSQKKVPASLVSPALIEIFLSSYGVGVLSISLSLDTKKLCVEDALTFNYRLSQLRAKTAAKLYLPHPSDNQERWEALSPEHKAGIPHRPQPDAPLPERLGKSGGTWLLGELMRELLRPLESFQLKQVQDQFSVYTVVRFEDAVDFEKPEVCEEMASFLSGLAEVEEPSHAGSPRGSLGVTNAILNRRHRVGVGLLGCAHLIADQPPPEHPFNSARMPRIFLKYFIPYLVALIQRTVLHRAIYDAGELVLSSKEHSSDSLAALRKHLLAFAVEGYFTEVSYREAIHRFYRLAQQGLDVRIALDDARRAVSDIDARQTTDTQVKLAEDTATNVRTAKKLQKQMTKNMRIVAKVQTRVEWIEVFLVSVYLAHLWHMFAEEHDKHPWLSYGVAISALVGLIGAAIILRPWQHDKH